MTLSISLTLHPLPEGEGISLTLISRRMPVPLAAARKPFSLREKGWDEGKGLQ